MPNQRRDKQRRRRSNIPCKFFRTPKGCKFGDKCRFQHPQPNLEMENKKWWRKGPAPQEEEKKRPQSPLPSDVSGSFRNQFVTLLVMPRRVRTQIHTIACFVADLVRSYIPVSSFHRDVSLVPLLGNLHEWPLVVMEACPATSRVVIGGLNTPLIVIDEGSDTPRWLCGPTWKENGLPNYNSQFSSARVTCIDITDSGVIMFATYCTIQADSPDLDPRGLYAVDLDEKPHKLKFVENGKRLSLNQQCDFMISRDCKSLYVVQAGSQFQPSVFFEMEFDEDDLDREFTVKKRIALSVSPANFSINFLRDDLFLLTSTRHGGSNAVFLDSSTGQCSNIPVNIDILGLSKCSNDSLLIHSVDHIRVTSKDSFIDSISDGNLKERLQTESHKLYQKKILIDLPLLGYDSRNQQIITDTDARVVSFVDLY